MNNTQLCWMIGVPTVTVILIALDNHRLARQLQAKLDRMLEKDDAPALSGNHDADSRKDDVPASRTHTESAGYDIRPHEEFRAMLKTRTK